MKISVREMVEIAMLVAVAIILDLPFLKFRIGENGGSISLTMLPLIIMSYRHNIFKTFIGCGIVYGFLTCLIDGWGLMYFPFDYLLGYGFICFGSLFRKKILENKSQSLSVFWILVSLGIVLILRIISSSISSIVFYGFNLMEALVYNVSYIVPSGIILSVVLILLFKPLLLVEKRFKTKSI